LVKLKLPKNGKIKIGKIKIARKNCSKKVLKILVKNCSKKMVKIDHTPYFFYRAGDMGLLNLVALLR